MKKTFFVVLLVLSLVVPAALLAVEVNFKVRASANVAPGAVVVADYFSAIRNYNGVTDNEIMVIKRRGITEEQIPVVMFIAAKANVKPAVILDLRRQGKSWFDIALRFGLGADTFYVPVDGPVYGHVYGRLYSYYNRPWRDWRNIVLSDDDVVNFVNLSFMVDHYGYRPDEVIRMRDGGQSFTVINRNFYNDKARRGYGWRDRNNNWHDRDRNWKPVDRTWRDRQTYWKNYENRWQGNKDAKWQQRMREQNYKDNQRWHGRYKEADFRDDRREYREDQRERKEDRREYREDKRERAEDKREYREDKRERKEDRNEYREDKMERREDRQEYREDKRERREDRQENREEVRDNKGERKGQADEEATKEDKDDRNGHDNGKGNNFQNNGRGNRK